jgi:hypothetical protein
MSLKCFTLTTGIKTGLKYAILFNSSSILNVGLAEDVISFGRLTTPPI